MNSRKKIYALALLTSFAPAAAWASIDPAAMKTKLTEAEKLYSKRDRSSSLNELIEIASQTEASADADVKYGSLLLGCKGLYFKGLQAKGEEKTGFFSQGMSKCDAARSLKPEWADAYYFYAKNLAAWTQAQGMSALTSRKAELLAYLHSTIALKTRDGRAGETLDGQGAKRELGRLYLRLPEHAGGSQERAVEFLSEAQTKAPSAAENTSLLAEALLDGSDAEIARGRQMLKEFTAKKGDFDSTREPETAIEMARAKALLNQI